MKKNYILWMFVAMFTVFTATSCKDDDEKDSPIAVSYSGLTANGSTTETSTAITLTFDKAIEGLAAADITLTTGETGATKGALTDKGSGVYELAITGVAKAGEVTVAVAKSGYTIAPASKTVALFYVKPAIEVAFSALAANGSATETSTALTLTLDKAIEGLTVEDITLTAGETGAVKGALTDKGSGMYELTMTGVTKVGEVTVAITKAGYTIAPASKTANVFYVNPAIEVAFTAIAANGSATKTSTALTLTFDKDIEGLTAADILLTTTESVFTRGGLTGKGNGVYELAMTGVTKGGEVVVAVAKDGYIITPASKTVKVNYAKPVSFTSLTVNGSATQTTDQLTVVFSEEVLDFAPEHITLNAGDTGAKITGCKRVEGSTYTVALSGITKSGEITLTIVADGYDIAPASKTVAVTYTKPIEQVAFTGLTANGSSVTGTQSVTITLDKAVEGLSASDITLTKAGATNVSIGAPTDKGNGKYECNVSRVVSSTTVTISLKKDGYVFTPESRDVVLRMAQ